MKEIVASNVLLVMCKSKQTETDKSETIETSNYGLMNFSEAGLGTMGLVEILVIILLLMALGMAWVYYCKKKKKQRMRELNNAMRDGLAYRPANSEIYPHRSSMPIPLVQFQTPGNRTVSMQQQQEPSAPAQTPLGLWDQCR